MRKILHISKYYYPYKGGIEDVCRSLTENISEYEQSVLCFNNTHEDVEETIHGVHITRVGIWKELKRQPISFHYLSTMFRIIREYQPDIIQLHVPNPLVSLYSLYIPKNIKLIVHWHSDIIVHGFIHYCISPVETLLLKRADCILATSPEYIAGSRWLSRFQQKCVVIPNIISAAKLDMKPSTGITVKSIHDRYGKKIVFFVGRHVGYKGINFLIQSAKLVKTDCVFLIAGSGPETGRLKNMASESRNIRFIGRIPDDELGTYMRAADVFAFSSFMKNEAFGVVLAEAMYCGAVPVTFHIAGSGVNWVSLAEKTGIEVPNKDVQAYAEAIDRILTDDSLRKNYSEAAKTRIRNHFMFDSVHDTLLSVYNKL